jgi:hypothetical protein
MIWRVPGKADTRGTLFPAGKAGYSESGLSTAFQSRLTGYAKMPFCIQDDGKAAKNMLRRHVGQQQVEEPTMEPAAFECGLK